MHLDAVPIVCVLVGLTLYLVLGGADFGAGLWQLLTLVDPRRSEAARRDGQALREHAHHSMGPVWEANHVWLIFVLTVTWTAYPRAFGAIASTLAVPLLIAGVGIVLRGAAYALRAGTSGPRESALIDTAFSLSSVLTPFALGTMIGAIVLGRVPADGATGGVWTSWTTPLSLLLGALTVLLCAYLAAVYLAADAAREARVATGSAPVAPAPVARRDPAALAERFRTRALGAAVLAGALAIALLAILHSDAHRFADRLTGGIGLVGVIVSALAGLTTLGLVVVRRYEPARASAALAVAGLIAGFALAQDPFLLPGLTLARAAAPDATLVSLLAAVAAGVVILFPSLGVLFSLQLRGRFGDGPDDVAGGVVGVAVGGLGAGVGVGAGPGAPGRSGAPDPPVAGSVPRTVGGVLARSRPGLAARGAIAGLLGGLGFLTAADAPWAHIVGVVSLAVCAECAIVAVSPTEVAAADPEPPSPPVGP